jgi:hypothetical protein
MPSQKQRTKLRKEADRLVGRYVKLRDGRCMDEDRPHFCEGGIFLQWAHLIGRGYLIVRYDEDNSVTLCRGAHMYYTQRKLEWDDWCKAYLGEERWEALRQRAKAGGTPDYEAIIEEYSSRLMLLG